MAIGKTVVTPSQLKLTRFVLPIVMIAYAGIARGHMREPSFCATNRSGGSQTHRVPDFALERVDRLAQVPDLVPGQHAADAVNVAAGEMRLPRLVAAAQLSADLGRDTQVPR